MECNKDEAIRAKDIAVRKFAEKDYNGAKKFALKAQTLYPGLEGVSHMLTTLDVYVSAENKINGEMDMYGILGVNPSADDDMIKKHYRKLVLLLHPDKNKSVGADGAFQLVTEAFNFLSDKAKRSVYNIRRNAYARAAQQKVPSKPGVSANTAAFRNFYPKVPTPGGSSTVPPSSGRATDQRVPTQSGSSRTPQQNVPQQSGGSVFPPGVNGYHNNSNNTPSSGKSKKTSTKKAPNSAQGIFKKDDTFWTVCTRCRMQYEYVRYYLNQTLKCPHCQVGFVAVEIPPPSNLSSSSVQQQHQKSSSRSGPNIYGLNNSFGGAGARWSPFFGTSYCSTSSASNSTQAAGGSWVGNERVKREREEEPATARWEWNNDSGSVLRRDVPLKKRREDDFGRNAGGTTQSASQTGTGNWVTGMANVFQGVSSKFDVIRELSLGELRKILSERALREIQKKVKELKTEEKAKVKVKERQKSKLVKNVAIEEEVDSDKVPQSRKSSSPDFAGDIEPETAEMVAMSVPDPDFYVFDLDRSENCFQENQVWATYDNDDGMPRFFALIHDVVSLDPFKVRISWLNSKTNTEFSSSDWIGRGFRKSCGDFRVGRHEINKLLNSFSHKVKWVKGPRGVIQIYPHKGDVWALYKNWSSEWDENTPNEVIHAYEMVEVLEDYDKDQGTYVAPVIKAPGFRTVFYKQLEPKEVKHIPKEEMFRFSHQVPCHVLTGEEKPNAPKGYVELDPAATPLDLLQVIEPATEENS